MQAIAADIQCVLANSKSNGRSGLVLNLEVRSYDYCDAYLLLVINWASNVAFKHDAVMVVAFDWCMEGIWEREGRQKASTEDEELKHFDGAAGKN
jgi:hypothetical protein